MKKISKIILAVLSLSIGLYPLIYFFIDRKFGLLSSKSVEILNNSLWNIAFYGHIILGGIALFIGWIQFNEKFRSEKIKLHRLIGKIYVVTVLISGVCGLFIALYATGGLISKVGFLSLGVIWLLTTILGFKAIKEGNITKHKKMMIYSYAACFGAVTLRIYLPILISLCEGFTTAYKIVAWLSWVPNIIVAYFIVKKNRIK